jgi:hypothetical protein
MNHPKTSPARGVPVNESYREQIARWARAMASADEEAVRAALAPTSPPERLALFVEGNLEKRAGLLGKYLEFVAGAFDGHAFEHLLAHYVEVQPMTAYASPTEDADRFLAWLERQHRLTPEQKDYVACQRARHAVEAEAAQNRAGHLRFQEYWSVAEALLEELGTNAGLRVHLNPIRVWSRFHTRALLDEDAEPPADVLFFAVRRTISTAVLEPEGQALVRELAEFGPVTLEEWLARGDAADRDALLEFCHDGAAMGLVAFS